LLRDMTYARQHAVATGARTWVVFDANAETWTVMSEDASSPGRAGASVLDDPGTGQTFVQALDAGTFANVQIVSATFDGQAEVGFDWLGRPLNASEALLSASGRVTLTDGYRVDVNAVTGHITMSEAAAPVGGGPLGEGFATSF
jgi:hypothetical protein